MSHQKHKQQVCALLMGAALITASGGVVAQSLDSSVSVGLSNLEYGGDMNILSLSYDESPGGLAQTDLAPIIFDGLNGSGFTETMSFAGGASAFVVVPGQRPGLHVAAHGTLLNTFYNSNNPPYFDATVDPHIVDENGVPDYFYVSGKAAKVELLSYGGFGASQYYARYVYHIHGHVEGDGLRNALLMFQVGNNPMEVAYFEPNLPNGEIVASYGTQLYPVANGMSHEEKTTFLVMFEVDTQSVPEGSNFTGFYDFSETITLDHIDVVDENNNPVSGWTVTPASGLDYDLPIFRSDFDPVVVEPEAIASNAVELCARLRGLHQDAPMVLRRTSLCEEPIGMIREIKFRQVGASDAQARD